MGYSMCMRLHISLDSDIVEQIDEIAGKRGRSAFIRGAVSEEVARRRRSAAIDAAFGSVPDFAPYMTPQWISAERKRETEERNRYLDEYRRRHDRSD